ncbi:hypothetical protein [Pseudomonas sp. RW3S2]|uniref:hypothetical protein n=1 Tax=Pseudomonas sp. RW3S2 TaxID=485884 RepID=UPI001647F563|nr:hypothetical protein [Pseudomonas sp. RW3S2]MBC3419749.1 hypothetical protein [Pseudomonas sp. RW3S2]
MNSFSQGTGLDLKNAVIDDSDGTELTKANMAAFEKHMASTSAKPPTGLSWPYVNGAVEHLPNANFGISDELIDEDPKGVIVTIKAWAGIQERDTLLLYWDDFLVASLRIDHERLKKTEFSLIVADDYIPRGLKVLRYEVLSKDCRTRSLTVTTLVRFGQPGVEGEKGKGQELAAPIVSLPASGEIGMADAEGKIKVTIPRYLSAHAGDRIHLFWGHDHSVEHFVSADEARGKAIVIEVDASVIKQAGDSDALPVYYYVCDEVGNESEWSVNAWAKVNLTGLELAAPVVLDSDGAVIETGVIDPFIFGKDATHLEVRVSGAFQSGDSITLHWNGTTEAGQAIPATYGPEVITRATKEHMFKVPFEVLVALAGGGADLSYTLTRNGLRAVSKVAFFDIAGEGAGLVAPLLDPADGFWVDANHRVVHVLIPVQAMLEERDQVTVNWMGTPCSGDEHLNLNSRMFRVSSQRVGKQIPIRLSGPDFLKPLDGGWVDISYTVVRGGKTFHSEVVRYYIGDPAVTLPAPFPGRELPDGILDPKLPEYAFGMQIDIPQEGVDPTPCTVAVVWETSEGGYYEDEEDVESGGEVSPFLIPEHLLAIESDEPVTVWVTYYVDRASKPTHASETLTFRIATEQMLAKTFALLNVPAAQNGKLDLGQIGLSGLVVEVPQYAGMAVGDRIRIKFSGASVTVHTVEVIGKQSVNIPMSAWRGVSNSKSVVMTYEVERNPSGSRLESRSVTVDLLGVLVSATFEDFESCKPQNILEDFVLPALTVQRFHGVVSLMSGVTSASYLPIKNNCLVLSAGTVKILLRSGASAVSFDTSGSHGMVHEVCFYSAENKLIKNVKVTVGSTSYATKVTCASLDVPIKYFTMKRPDTCGTVLIDNVDYELA